MADEEKTEVVVDEKKTEEVVVEEKVEEKTTEEKAAEESDKKETEAMEKFDEILDSEEDDSAAEEDGEEQVAKEEAPAKEEAAKVTSEDDSINAAADDLEKEIDAEFAKTPEQKATEKAEAEQELADEAVAQAKKDEEEAEKPYDCGLSTDPDGDDPYEPALVEALNKQGQDTLNRAVKAEKANEVLSSRLDQASADRNADWLDRKFETLGENFDEVLGNGEFDDLEVGGTQRANRIAVSKRMGVTIDAYVKAGKAIPTRTKLFSMAVNNLFNKETKQPETDKKTIASATKRAKNVLGGGGKKSKAVSGAVSNTQKQKAFDDMLDE
jgi:hypothetical protein